ncbi:MAG: DMT family transporter [Dechloromonas sp.]|nr:MAG: DMT family transporter [Dechloromonas sp.]
MDPRRALDGRATGIMTVLCLIWGLQQVVLKAAAPDITPLLQIALRSGVAALLVGLLMCWRRERLDLASGNWRPGLLVGTLFGLEFLLVGEGLRFTSASHMVVLLYTAPIFVALGLHWKLPAERLSAMQWLGIAMAFAGIALAFFGRSQPAPGGDALDMLWGDLLALLAGAAWGATTVVVRLSSLSRAPATQTLFYQLSGGFVILMLAALALGQTSFRPTALAWGSLLFQSLIVSFASYLVWFWLLKHYLASRLGVFSFLTPLFGMVFGVWLLDEPLEPGFIAGTALVLGGVALVSGYSWLQQRLREGKRS